MGQALTWLAERRPEAVAMSDDDRALTGAGHRGAPGPAVGGLRLSAFVDGLVVPLAEANAELLDDARAVHGPSDGYSEPVHALLREVRERSAEAGYHSMFTPESLGGADLGASALYEVWRHLHARCGPGRLLPFAAVAHWSYGPGPLCTALTAGAAQRMLPDFLAGRTTACFAMSEPDAGSDALAMSTTARRDGDGRQLTGTKQWIPNSPEADWAFVWAVTDRDRDRRRSGGISCFLVPTDDVRLPDDALVGTPHQGMGLAMAGGVDRPAAQRRTLRRTGAAGAGQGTGYAWDRSAFGRTIAEYQGVSFPLADGATEIYAADSMSRAIAAKPEAGEPARAEIAMTKVHHRDVLAGLRAVHAAPRCCAATSPATCWDEAALIVRPGRRRAGPGRNRPGHPSNW